MNPKRRWLLTAGVAAFAALVPAAIAWACIPVVTLDVSPAQARAGEEVVVTGRPFGKTNPVLIRFNAVDGPVLATLQPDKDRLVSGSVVIPADAAPGNYVLVATQEAKAGETTWGVPARTLLQVVGEGGAPVLGQPLAAPVLERPATVVEDEPVGAGTLLLVALGAAGVAMFAAGVVALAAGRRRGPAAEAIPLNRL